MKTIYILLLSVVLFSILKSVNKKEADYNHSKKEVNLLFSQKVAKH